MSSDGTPLTGRGAALVFVAFAGAYFCSALLRAVTATLAPEFSRELGLGAAQLGLLAGAYFLGFAGMQLPLGAVLDKRGSKHVLVALLLLGVAACLAFAMARSLWQMSVLRLLIGVAMSACLMAPLTLFRHRFSASLQLRANSWMLMTGSLGMLASTLPVQYLLPALGWRGLFVAIAGLLLLSVALVQVLVPMDAGSKGAGAGLGGSSSTRLDAAAVGRAEPGYADVFRMPLFRRLAPAAFFSYGGMIAMQSLWIGPWLTQVGQRSPQGAAAGLFLVNACMLVAFFCWGLAVPRLLRSGWHAEKVMAWAWWPGLLCLLFIVWRGSAAGPVEWAAWCVMTSVVSLSQPAVAQAASPALAGRALSAFNLVIFLGVFVIQWGLGLLIDALGNAGWPLAQAYRAAFTAYGLCCLASFLWMHQRGVAHARQ